MMRFAQNKNLIRFSPLVRRLASLAVVWVGIGSRLVDKGLRGRLGGDGFGSGCGSWLLYDGLLL